MKKSIKGFVGLALIAVLFTNTLKVLAFDAYVEPTTDRWDYALDHHRVLNYGILSNPYGWELTANADLTSESDYEDEFIILWYDGRPKPDFEELEPLMPTTINYLLSYGLLPLDTLQIKSDAHSLDYLIAANEEIVTIISDMSTVVSQISDAVNDISDIQDQVKTDGFKVGANYVVKAQGAAVADGATNAATNAPTNLNVVTTLLGSLTGEVNATNTKQNDLATKYNDLATKFNALLTRLEAHGLIAE